MAMRSVSFHITIFFAMMITLTSCAALYDRSATPGIQTGEMTAAPLLKRHDGNSAVGQGASEFVGPDAGKGIILSEMEQIYRKIIRDFPDTPLAQESYLKLITMYLEEYEPPAYERASFAYQEFAGRYPRFFMHGLIEEKMDQAGLRHFRVH